MPILSLFTNNKRPTEVDSGEMVEPKERRCFFGLLSMRSGVIVNATISLVSNDISLSYVTIYRMNDPD